MESDTALKLKVLSNFLKFFSKLIIVIIIIIIIIIVLFILAYGTPRKHFMFSESNASLKFFPIEF
jgi:hypothetical protein